MLSAVSCSDHLHELNPFSIERVSCVCSLFGFVSHFVTLVPALALVEARLARAVPQGVSSPSLQAPNALQKDLTRLCPLPPVRRLGVPGASRPLGGICTVAKPTCANPGVLLERCRK